MESITQIQAETLISQLEYPTICEHSIRKKAVQGILERRVIRITIFYIEKSVVFTDLATESRVRKNLI